MHEQDVIQWLSSRLDKYQRRFRETHPYTIEQYISELRAIADEAELRIKNPNYPEKNG